MHNFFMRIKCIKYCCYTKHNWYFLCHGQVVVCFVSSTILSNCLKYFSLKQPPPWTYSKTNKHYRVLHQTPWSAKMLFTHKLEYNIGNMSNRQSQQFQLHMEQFCGTRHMKMFQGEIKYFFIDVGACLSKE